MNREILERALKCLEEAHHIIEHRQDAIKRGILIEEISKYLSEPDGNNIYIVTAYRFGDKHNHSYVVGSFSTKEEAIRQAKIEEEWRGGKYDCEVIAMKLNDALKYKNYEVVYKKSA